jgi:putative ABC transport system ATP-binding protein
LLGSARLVARRAGSHPGVLLTATLTALVATDGHVVVDGQKLGDLDERGLLRLRRERIGFVFQSFGLLPFLSARENAGVPLRMLRRPAAEREERITELLTTVGLAGHADGPRSSPAASSSGLRSPAPSPPGRACCWPTSRPVSWTPAPASR